MIRSPSGCSTTSSMMTPIIMNSSKNKSNPHPHQEHVFSVKEDSEEFSTEDGDKEEDENFNYSFHDSKSHQPILPSVTPHNKNKNNNNDNNHKGTILPTEPMIPDITQRDYWIHNPNSTSTVSLDDWGMPGYLSLEEYNVLIQFHDQVHRRGKDFYSTVCPFEISHELEVYALCRWLRASKFNLSLTLRQVEEAMEISSQARKQKFYPDPYQDALGVDPWIYRNYYPQYYHGRAKNGSPIYISKPGLLNFPAVACITTIEGILRYHWYSMIHDLNQQFQHAFQESQANLKNALLTTHNTWQDHSSMVSFRRYQTLIIMDLQNLSSSIVTSSKYPLQLVRVQSNIDQKCFPETLDRMIIINAPSFFTLTWRVIKAWVEPRNASKVELFGKSEKEQDRWRLRLLELIEEENLPMEYRISSSPNLHTQKDTDATELDHTLSTGERKNMFPESLACPPDRSTVYPSSCKKDMDSNPTQHPSSMDRNSSTLKLIRRSSHYIHLRTNPSTGGLNLHSNEIFTCHVYTRSLSGGYLQIMYKKQEREEYTIILPYQAKIHICHKGVGLDEETPTCSEITNKKWLQGWTLDQPGIYQFQIHPVDGRLHGSFSEDFVVAVWVYEKPFDHCHSHQGNCDKTKEGMSGSIPIDPSYTSETTSPIRIQSIGTGVLHGGSHDSVNFTPLLTHETMKQCMGEDFSYVVSPSLTHRTRTKLVGSCSDSRLQDNDAVRSHQKVEKESSSVRNDGTKSLRPWSTRFLCNLSSDVS